VRWPRLGQGNDRRGDVGDDSATTVEVAPMNVTRLAHTHAVLTTWALPTGDDREAACDSYSRSSPDSMQTDDLPEVRCAGAWGTWRVEGDAIRIDFDETSREVAEGKLGPLIRARCVALPKPRDGKRVLTRGKPGDHVP
jgi:hypothetical protein